jgi:hypothetical protein
MGLAVAHVAQNPRAGDRRAYLQGKAGTVAINARLGQVFDPNRRQLSHARRPDAFAGDYNSLRDGPQKYLE